MIEISETASVSKLADIEASTRGSKTVVGAGSRIDSFVKIKPVGGLGDVIIGSNCEINSGTVIYSGNGIQIGSNVLIAANCTLVGCDHAYMDAGRLIRDQRFLPSKGGIVIEDDVWIGAGSIILEGSILRAGCVIGAGSIVRGEVAPYSINPGNPSRIGTKYRVADDLAKEH